MSAKVAQRSVVCEFLLAGPEPGAWSPLLSVSANSADSKFALTARL